MTIGITPPAASAAGGFFLKRIFPLTGFFLSKPVRLPFDPCLMGERS